MFPTSFGLRSQMILASFGECMFDDQPPRPGRQSHPSRRPNR
jgi:hypothetical protein